MIELGFRLELMNTMATKATPTKTTTTKTTTTKTTTTVASEVATNMNVEIHIPAVTTTRVAIGLQNCVKTLFVPRHRLSLFPSLPHKHLLGALSLIGSQTHCWRLAQLLFKFFLYTEASVRLSTRLDARACWSSRCFLSIARASSVPRIQVRSPTAIHRWA